MKFGIVPRALAPRLFAMSCYLLVVLDRLVARKNTMFVFLNLSRNTIKDLICEADIVGAIAEENFFDLNAYLWVQNLCVFERQDRMCERLRFRPPLLHIIR